MRQKNFLITTLLFLVAMSLATGLYFWHRKPKVNKPIRPVVQSLGIEDFSAVDLTQVPSDEFYADLGVFSVPSPVTERLREISVGVSIRIKMRDVFVLKDNEQLVRKAIVYTIRESNELTLGGSAVLKERIKTALRGAGIDAKDVTFYRAEEVFGE